jgi:hypothetical protein
LKKEGFLKDMMKIRIVTTTIMVLAAGLLTADNLPNGSEEDIVLPPIKIEKQAPQADSNVSFFAQMPVEEESNDFYQQRALKPVGKSYSTV